MRLQGWEKSFNALLEAKRKQAFEWGVNDCCLFTADFICAITGFDPANGIRGTYADEKAALSLLRSFNGIQGVASRFLDGHFNKINVRQSTRGDAIMIKITDKREAFGVNVGQYAAFSSHDGVSLLPIEAAIAAWRVE